MSDNQRRAICRLVFLLTCALPTAVCGYWICHPPTAAGWAQTIKAEIGVEAEIEFIATPTPFVTVLHGVRLTDPEYGSLLETAAIEIKIDKQVHVRFPHQLNRVNNRGLAKLIKTIHQTPLRRAVEKEWRFSFAEPIEISRIDAAELFAPQGRRSPLANNLLELNRKTLVIDQLQIDVEPSFEGTLVAANFAIAHRNALAAPQQQRRNVEIKLKKERHSDTIWFNTADQSLPCWLIAEFSQDIADGLGSDATFAGDIKLRTSAIAPSEALIQGQFNRLNAPQYGFNAGRLSADLHCHFYQGSFKNWDANLNIPHDGQLLRFPVAAASLYPQAQRIVVADAIQTAITDGMSPRVAAEPATRGPTR